MGWDKDGRKEVIRVGVEFFEDGSRVKAVDENSLTTGSFGVREEVEELEATRIGLRSLGFTNRRIYSEVATYEICVVRVSRKGNAGVGSVTMSQVGGKIPEVTVWRWLVNISLRGIDRVITLRFSNEVDSASQFSRGFGGGRHA